MVNILIVVFSFILIFAFNSVDNFIAPMAEELSRIFNISLESSALFVSVCTGGTVLGLIFGPSIVNDRSAKRVLSVSALIMTVSQILFALCTHAASAVILRFLAGICSGLIASVMWNLTFHGVSKKYFPAMIAVLMSARPLATALGVPAAGLLSAEYSMKTPLICLGIMTGLSGLLLSFLYPDPQNGSETENTEIKKDASSVKDKLASIFSPYIQALSVPYALPYYIGSAVNRMAYFGFYSFCGIWFVNHYGMDIQQISKSLLYIGTAECLINFIANRIIKLLGHRFTFLSSFLISLAIFPVFIYGKTSLNTAIALIAVFMALDRIYSMTMVISIPDMFPSVGNKTAFGSLNTLTAWGAAALISAVQGLCTKAAGMTGMESLMFFCFISGGAAITYVQQQTSFKKKVLSCNQQN